MSMMRKTITLPLAMEEWVKAQIEAGRYANDSEYFRDLIRRDQDRRRAEGELRRMLEEAEASGVSERTIPEIMADVKARMKADGRLPSDG